MLPGSIRIFQTQTSVATAAIVPLLDILKIAIIFNNKVVFLFSSIVAIVLRNLDTIAYIIL